MLAMLMASQLTALAGVNFSWTDNSDNEAGFRLYRILDDDTTELVASTGVNENGIEGVDVATGDRYFVVAFNSRGESGRTNVVVIPDFPAAPTGFQLVIEIKLISR